MFFQLGTGEVQARFFEQAGFAGARSERIQTVLLYESEEHACAAAFAGGPVAMAYSRFDDKTRDEAHAEYIESISPFRHKDGFEIPGEFVVTMGARAGSA